MKTDIKKALFINKNAGLEVIADKKFSSNPLDTVAKYLHEGYKFVILTNKDYSDREFFDFASKLRQLTSIYDALLIISERLDVTKTEDANGILLDDKSVSKDKAVKFLSDECLIGYRNIEISGFDFYISDGDCEDKNKIMYRKINKIDNIIIYKKACYDINLFNKIS